MRSLLYISGPSCSGKSTLSKGIAAAFPEYTYIAGDNHWLKHDGHDFSDRVHHTNRSILSELEQSDSPDILLEWVPAYGQFVEDIFSICKENDRFFFQIILNAANQTLKHRKMRRDGDADTCCIKLQAPIDIEGSLTIDTTVLYPDQILNKALDWITSKSLERTRH